MSLTTKFLVAIASSLITISVISAGYQFWITPISRTFSCQRSVDKANCTLTKHYLRGDDSLIIQETDIGSVTQTSGESYSGRFGTQHIMYAAVVTLKNGLKYEVIRSVDNQQPVNIAVERISTYLANPSSSSISVGY